MGWVDLAIAKPTCHPIARLDEDQAQGRSSEAAVRAVIVNIPALKGEGITVQTEIVGRFMSITVRGAPTAITDLLRERFASWHDLPESLTDSVYFTAKIVWM